jgi:hypothetical protein
MGNIFEKSNPDEEYEQLRTAVTNIYRDTQIHESISDNKAFSSNQEEHERLMTAIVKDVANSFISNFSEHSSDDAPKYKKYTIGPINTPLLRGELPISDQELRDLFARNINHLFLCEIRKHLSLSSTKIGKMTVADFMNRAVMMNANAIIGMEGFSYNDPDYKIYDEFKRNSINIEVYGDGVHAAFNSQLIKVSIRNSRVLIRCPDDEYIQNEIAQNSAMTINDYSISIDDEVAAEYLRNSRRFVSIEMELAVTCLGNKIGIGFCYSV